MSEAAILKAVHLAAGSLPGVRLFRNQVGTGAAGQVIERPSEGVLLVRGRPVTMGLTPGSSDLIGWRTITITAEMVGQKLAQFTAIEVKSETGRTSPQQENFIRVLNSSGGLGAVVRSAEKAADMFADVDK